MSAQQQFWVRAELEGPGTPGLGAQLMIPADGLEIHGADIVFHCKGDVVYVAEPGRLRSVTWLPAYPNPGYQRRKARWPNAGTRWTQDQREALRQQLASGEPWDVISDLQGRSRTGVQQEAAKQGWIDPESLEVKPEVVAEAGRQSPPAEPAADSEAEVIAVPAPRRGDDDPGGGLDPVAEPRTTPASAAESTDGSRLEPVSSSDATVPAGAIGIKLHAPLAMSMAADRDARAPSASAGSSWLARWKPDSR